MTWNFTANTILPKLLSFYYIIYFLLRLTNQPSSLRFPINYIFAKTLLATLSLANLARSISKNITLIKHTK